MLRTVSHNKAAPQSVDAPEIVWVVRWTTSCGHRPSCKPNLL